MIDSCSQFQLFQYHQSQKLNIVSCWELMQKNYAWYRMRHILLLQYRAVLSSFSLSLETLVACISWTCEHCSEKNKLFVLCFMQFDVRLKLSSEWGKKLCRLSSVKFSIWASRVKVDSTHTDVHNYKNPLLLQPAIEVLLFTNEFLKEKGLNMKWPFNCGVMKLKC